MANFWLILLRVAVFPLPGWLNAIAGGSGGWAVVHQSLFGDGRLLGGPGEAASEHKLRTPDVHQVT